MQANGLEIFLFVFFSALIITAIFRQLKLSVILGYLVVGALAGPHMFGIINDSPGINELAEFGIVFLMFTVGLEFSLKKFLALKFHVFVMGGLQVLFSIIFTTLVGKLFGMSTLSALGIGSIVAMSSTAVVVKQLNDQSELQTSHGLSAIGILLFQDLAVIPIIILIAGLASNSSHHLGHILLWALLKGIFAIVLIFIMGRWLLRPLFRAIAKTRAIELFTLTVLLVTLSAAWITNILGLSYALGAFLAGIMLAETEFRHQIEVEIRPFRDILLGLFFISIGMLTDFHPWYQTWQWIALLLFALIVGKGVLITVIGRLTGKSMEDATRTGLVLAQGGEFGFAILTLALSNKLIPADYGQVVLAALILSIAISPILIYFNKQITELFLRKKIKFDEANIEEEIHSTAKQLQNHVIICGYGRVGQHIARMLDKVECPHISLDLDSAIVRTARKAGNPVAFGDSSHPEILKAAGIHHAKVLVISFGEIKTASKILAIVKQVAPNIPILVRCRDLNEFKQLKEFQPNTIIAEIFETSLTLSKHLLDVIQVPRETINSLIRDVRAKDYDILKKVLTEDGVQELENNTTLL